MVSRSDFFPTTWVTVETEQLPRRVLASRRLLLYCDCYAAFRSPAQKEEGPGFKTR
jgi:hypothetical protein